MTGTQYEVFSWKSLCTAAVTVHLLHIAGIVSLGALQPCIGPHPSCHAGKSCPPNTGVQSFVSAFSAFLLSVFFPRFSRFLTIGEESTEKSACEKSVQFTSDDGGVQQGDTALYSSARPNCCRRLADWKIVGVVSHGARVRFPSSAVIFSTRDSFPSTCKSERASTNSFGNSGSN